MGGCVIWFVQFSVVQVGDGRVLRRLIVWEKSYCRVWSDLNALVLSFSTKGDGKSIDEMNRDMNNAGFVGGLGGGGSISLST